MSDDFLSRLAAVCDILDELKERDTPQVLALLHLTHELRRLQRFVDLDLPTGSRRLAIDGCTAAGSHVVGVLGDADNLACLLKQQFAEVKSASLRIEAALFSRILRSSTIARSETNHCSVHTPTLTIPLPLAAAGHGHFGWSAPASPAILSAFAGGVLPAAYAALAPWRGPSCRASAPRTTT